MTHSGGVLQPRSDEGAFVEIDLQVCAAVRECVRACAALMRQNLEGWSFGNGQLVSLNLSPSVCLSLSLSLSLSLCVCVCVCVCARVCRGGEATTVSPRAHRSRM